MGSSGAQNAVRRDRGGLSLVQPSEQQPESSLVKSLLSYATSPGQVRRALRVLEESGVVSPAQAKKFEADLDEAQQMRKW